MPTVNSSESPGRIENSPHAAKMMNATPHSHQLPRRPMRTAGSNQEGSSSGVIAAVMSEDTTLRVPFQPMSSLCDDGAVPPGDAPYEEFAQSVGVGPHPEPWPDDARYDPELLAVGDRRNVLDTYRYWTLPAIVADLDSKRRPLHVAIQNWEHAFNVAGVHILGRRRWNKRGALVTDRYLRVHHHASVADMAAWFAERDIPIVGVDNLPGSKPLETTKLPERVCLLFGSEGPGLTDEAVAACSYLVAIGQDGSTRSINAGAAAAIAMYAWGLQWIHTDLSSV